jgi:hypothetical protein
LRGDATAGRGYQESTPVEPNGNGVTSTHVPLGINPYFPDPPAPEQAGSTEETAANDIEASDGQPQVADQLEAEPTFDEATDRANGINTNDPAYKHFQRAYTRSRQKDKTDLERLEAKMEASLAKNKLEQAPTQQVPQEDAAIKLEWEGFVAPRLPETAQLHGYEEEIAEVVKAYAQHAVNNIARQQQAAFQRMQAEQTKTKITSFITELESTNPGKVPHVLKDLEEYGPIAKSDPEKWINFVKKAHGLEPAETTPTQTAPSGQRTIQQIRNAVPRPTTGNGATQLGARPQTTREAIEAAFDAHWKQ